MTKYSNISDIRAKLSAKKTIDLIDFFSGHNISSTLIKIVSGGSGTYTTDHKTGKVSVSYKGKFLVQNVQLSGSGNNLTLSGTSDALMVKGLSFSINFSKPGSEIILTFSTQARENPSLPLNLGKKQINLFSLQNLNLNFSIGIDTAVIKPLIIGTGGNKAMLSGELKIGTTDTANIYINSEDHYFWSMDADLGNNNLQIANFFELIGVNIIDSLPAPLKHFNDLAVTQMKIIYDAEGNRLGYFSFTISANEKWEIVSGIAVDKIEICPTILLPGQPASRSVTYQVKGEINFKGGGILDVVCTIPQPSAFIHTKKGSSIKLGVLTSNIGLPNIITNGLETTEIENFSMLIDPTQKEFDLDFELSSKTWGLDIGSFHLDISKLRFSAHRIQGHNQFGFRGNFSINKHAFSTFVNYDDKVWSFGASTMDSKKINVVDIVEPVIKQLHPNFSLPSIVKDDSPMLSNLSFEATDGPNASSKYAKFSGTVDWKMKSNFLKLELENIDFNLEVDKNGVKDCHFIGDAKFQAGEINLPLRVGYDHSRNNADNHLFVEWKGVTVDYTHSGTMTTYTMTLNDLSLGELIDHLMETVDSTFELPEPWAELNKIDLSGIILTYKRDSNPGSKETDISLTYRKGFNLKFFKLNSFTITKKTANGKPQVFMSLDGDLLGISLNKFSTGSPDGKKAKQLGSKEGAPLSSSSFPNVAGMGDQFFKLNLLGMGQHVRLTNAASIQHVNQAITAMQSAFQTSNDPKKIAGAGNQSLSFDQNSHWLIGADFVLAKFLHLGFVFNDPHLYGLAITVGSSGPHAKKADKAPMLNGLSFEILYKKISDSIGEYIIELKLPDILRHLEFGEVAVTLPIIGVQAYTDGSFMLDFGFPASLKDFSRSAALEVFPFVGFGGFYFGVMSEATATNLPAIKNNAGHFKPVIEFGFALSVGVGKTLEEGILKAGVSVTVQGMLKGILAIWHSSKSDHSELYYDLQGAVGISGHVFGEVRFAIISARVDIRVSIKASTVIEAYKPIPFHLKADVSVSLSVSVDLGLFSITIHCSFSTTIEESITIGSDTSANAPWNKIPAPIVSLADALAPAAANPELNWNLAKNTNKKPKPLTVLIVPQITRLANKQAACVLMSYIGIGGNASKVELTSDFAILVKALLNWAYDSIQNSTDLKHNTQLLLNYFRTRNQYGALPFDYDTNLQHFFENYLSIINTEVISTKTSLNHVAVFPMLPLLTLEGPNISKIDFSTYNKVDSAYLESIETLLAKDQVNHLSNNAEKSIPAADPFAKTTARQKKQQAGGMSIASMLLVDAFSMILQNALEKANKQPAGLSQEELIKKVCTQDNLSHFAGMTSRFLLHGLRLPAPPKPKKAIDLSKLFPLYQLSGQQFPINKASELRDVKMGINGLVPLWLNVNWLGAFSNGKSLLETTIDKQIILAKGTINKSFIPTPVPIQNYHDVEQVFNFSHPITLKGILSSPSSTLWKLPPHLRRTFPTTTGSQIDLKIQQYTSSHKYPNLKKDKSVNYQWATILDWEIQKISTQDLGTSTVALSKNMYNLIGADATCLQDLEQIASSNIPIDQFRIVFEDDPGSSDTGYISLKDQADYMGIVQANLSTATRPPIVTAVRNAAAVSSNIYNSSKEFIKLLLECSQTHQDGYYLYLAQTLPARLFDKKGKAKLRLLISFASQPSPLRCFNTLLTTGISNIKDTRVYAYSAQSEFLSRIASLPQGTIGFEVPNFNPKSGYLANQFNHIGINSIDQLSDYHPLSPVGVQKDDTDHSLYYRKTIPYSKLLSNPKPGQTFSPYVSIGKSPTIQLSNQDLFGNQFAPSSYAVNIPTIGYTDQLIGPKQWPAIGIHYTIDSGGQLQLNLDFATSRYQMTKQSGGANFAKKNIQNARASRLVYQQLIWQLETGDIALSFATTLNGSGGKFGSEISISTTKNGKLLTFLKAILGFLDQVINATTANPPAAIQFSSKAKIAIATDRHIVPLDVQLIMARTKNVDTNFQKVEGVMSKQLPVPPQMSSSTDKQLMKNFATQFETAFNKKTSSIAYKLAVAKVEDGDSAHQGKQQIFVLRFDSSGANGLWCQVSKGTPSPCFAAPLPLANTLHSFEAYMPTPYSSGKPYKSAKESIETKFHGIDLDAWASQVFAAIDQLFSPAYAVPLFIYDQKNKTSYLPQLRNLKQKLAQKVKENIELVIENTEPQAKAALASMKEKWYQALLEQLSNAYRYTVATYIPTELKGGDKLANSANFFGGIKEMSPHDSQAPYSLSTAKLPLVKGQASSENGICFLFECNHAAQHKNYTFNDLQYTISHIEVDESVASSGWLSLVLPMKDSANPKVGAIGSIKKTVLPVPLRAYPTPPSILGLGYDYKADSKTLKEAMQLDFNFTYRHPAAAQDKLHASMEFSNTTPVTNVDPNIYKTGSTLDLSLAAFIQSYPAIHSDLKQNLTKVTVNSPDKKSIQYALDAFILLVNQVRTDFNAVPSPMVGFAGVQAGKTWRPDSSIYKYTIEEEVDKSQLKFDIGADSSNPVLTSPHPIVLSLPEDPKNVSSGEQTIAAGKSKTFTLSPTAKKQSSDRKFSLSNFDILNHQNSWAAAYIIRNEDLLNNIKVKTNPKFLYRTPTIRPKDRMVPLLRHTTAIPINSIGTPSAKTLKAYMELLFTKLLADAKGKGSGSLLPIKLNCSYTYQPAGIPAPIRLPVFLVPHRELDITALDDNYTDMMTAWLNKKNPSRENGKWVLDLVMYSSLEESVPQVQLVFELGLDKISK